MQQYPYTKLRLRSLQNHAASIQGLRDRLGKYQDGEQEELTETQAQALELERLLEAAEQYERSKSWSVVQLWVLSAALLLSSLLVGAGLWQLIMG